ncbi:MAG: hypothetical protein GY832_08295, partial [Chloroflexi bacterium]|nr:hypothetical protein [Chloroflexota bacterium]
MVCVFFDCSYDAWYCNARLDSEDGSAGTRAAQWKVSANWVLDADDYNEWMNELDYLMPLPGVSSYLRLPRTRAAPQKAPE